MIFVFIRAGHSDYAASLVPILIVPSAHLIAAPLLRMTDSLLVDIPYQLSLAFVDIAAVAIACLLVILFSAKIKSKKNKNVYVILLSGYNIILTCAFVAQTLHPILQNIHFQ